MGLGQLNKFSINDFGFTIFVGAYPYGRPFTEFGFYIEYFQKIVHAWAATRARPHNTQKNLNKISNMKKPILLIFFSIIISFSNSAQIGIFEKAEDIGSPKVKGSSSYDEATQTYTLKGGGENIWFNHDEFHFLYKKIKGDFLMTANFQLIGNEDGNGHRKTGWMIRESNQHDAVSINSCVHGDGLAVLQWRLMRGAYMRDPEEEIFFPRPYFGENIIELERIGKKVTMRLAKPGEPFEEMGSTILPDLKDEVLIGLYSLAHDPTDLQEAKVWNVRISTPISPDWHPNRLVKTIKHDGLVSNSILEKVEIASGIRKVLSDGEEQIFNQQYSPDFKSINFTKGSDNVVMPINFVAENIETKSSLQGSSKKKQKNEILKSRIYYSEYKNGGNQIWSKWTDGTDVQQLTFDIDNAREPQISPDGKNLAYLAYPHDSNPKMAVSFQRMALKILPISGGSPKTVAYFFGGKGSLLANCWSGDSKSILFTSR